MRNNLNIWAVWELVGMGVRMWSEPGFSGKQLESEGSLTCFVSAAFSYVVEVCKRI